VNADLLRVCVPNCRKVRHQIEIVVACHKKFDFHQCIVCFSRIFNIKVVGERERGSLVGVYSVCIKYICSFGLYALLPITMVLSAFSLYMYLCINFFIYIFRFNTLNLYVALSLQLNI
jgi:hypothetical protein